MTPADVRDRRPAGLSPPPRPLRRGCSGRPLPRLSAAGAPRALCQGKARGPRAPRREQGPRGGGGVGVQVLRDPVPRSAHTPAQAQGLCHRPQPAGWETES